MGFGDDCYCDAWGSGVTRPLPVAACDIRVI